MRRGSSVQGRGVIGGVQETLIGVGGEPFGLHREQGGHAGFQREVARPGDMLPRERGEGRRAWVHKNNQTQGFWAPAPWEKTV